MAAALYRPRALPSLTMTQPTCGRARAAAGASAEGAGHELLGLTARKACKQRAIGLGCVLPSAVRASSSARRMYRRSSSVTTSKAAPPARRRHAKRAERLRSLRPRARVHCARNVSDSAAAHPRRRLLSPWTTAARGDDGARAQAGSAAAATAARAAAGARQVTLRQAPGCAWLYALLHALLHAGGGGSGGGGGASC